MPPAIRAVLLLLSVLISSEAPARGKSDYLIVEHVERLLVYNRYEQRATAAERALLKPFCPMKVASHDVLLSDGFTHAMRVEVDGQPFAFVIDASGKLASSGALDIQEEYQNVAEVADTVEILASRVPPQVSRNRRSLAVERGERLIRYFRRQDQTYCGRVDKSEYGWVDFRNMDEGKDWRVLVAVLAKAQPALPAVLPKIQKGVEEINRLIANLFAHFNRETGQSKTPPFWEVTASEESISCILRGAPSDASFKESTVYLVKNIENAVLGSNLTVEHGSGRIEIHANGR